MDTIYNNKEIICSLINKSRKMAKEIISANKYEDMSNATNRMEQQVSVKNIYENCRSALDYTMCFVNNELKLNIPIKDIQFPFFSKQVDFKKKELVKKIKEANIELYNFIKALQPFTSGGKYWWLKKFIEGNNKYKHRGFIPLRPFFKTKTFGWAQFGDIGVSVSKFSFGAGSPSILREEIDFQNDRSIEFEFRLEDNKTNIQNFLKEILDGTEIVINQIFSILNNK